MWRVLAHQSASSVQSVQSVQRAVLSLQNFRPQNETQKVNICAFFIKLEAKIVLK